MEEYYDLAQWTQGSKKFTEYMSKKEDSDIKIEFVSPISADTVKLYALLKSKISNKPNGLYTFVQQGLPLDNMIWWDFVLESEIGFIHIWRTTRAIEAITSCDSNFNMNKFFNLNIKKYIEEIKQEINKFDKHTTYINHYSSYDDCVKYLWEEVSKLNLNIPESPEKHITEKPLRQKYFNDVRSFSETSVKFHTLGKSLVLNSAFKTEAFLNLVIRVGATSELKNYPEIIKKHLGSTFIEKLKNLKFYSAIISDNVDLEQKQIKDVLELINLRNKYVHADETSSHNLIGEIYFDEDYPLHQISKDAPAIESMKQIFHRPDFSIVKKSYESADNFINYVESLFIPEYAEQLKFLLLQNPIGYNENKKIYSVVHNQLAIDFYLSPDESDNSEEE